MPVHLTMKREEWLEQIDDWRVRIKEACPLTLRDLACTVCSDRRKYFNGKDWFLFRSGFTREAASSKLRCFTVVLYAKTELYEIQLLGNSFGCEGLAFVLASPNPDVHKMKLSYPYINGPKLRSIMDPIDL